MCAHMLQEQKIEVVFCSVSNLDHFLSSSINHLCALAAVGTDSWGVVICLTVDDLDHLLSSTINHLCALAAAGTDIWGVVIWLSVDDLDHLLSSPVNQLCALAGSPPIRYWWDMRALMLKLPVSTCFASYNIYSDGWLLPRCCSVKKDFCIHCHVYFWLCFLRVYICSSELRTQLTTTVINFNNFH